jgi:hypothetical protein
LAGGAHGAAGWDAGRDPGRADDRRDDEDGDQYDDPRRDIDEEHGERMIADRTRVPATTRAIRVVHQVLAQLL